MTKQCSHCGQSYDEHEVSCPHCVQAKHAGEAAEEKEPSPSPDIEDISPLQGTWGESETPDEQFLQVWVPEPQSAAEEPPFGTIEDEPTGGVEGVADPSETSSAAVELPLEMNEEEPTAGELPLEMNEEEPTGGVEDVLDHLEASDDREVSEVVPPAKEQVFYPPATPSAARKRQEKTTTPTPSAWPGRLAACAVGAVLGAAACFGVLWPRGLTFSPEKTNESREDQQTVKAVAEKLGTQPTPHDILPRLDALMNLQGKAQERDAVAIALKGKGVVSDAQPDLVKGIENLVSSWDADKKQLARSQEENTKLTQFLTDIAKRFPPNRDRIALLSALDERLETGTTAVKERDDLKKKLQSVAMELKTKADQMLATEKEARANKELIDKLTDEFKKVGVVVKRKPDLLSGIRAFAADRMELQKAKPVLKDAAQTGKRMTQAGIKTALLEQGIGELIEQRDAFQATIQMLAKKLHCDPTQEALVKAVEALPPAPKRKTAQQIVQAGRILLDSGRPAEALRVLDQKPSEGEPSKELLVARAEARWRSYRHEHLRKQEKLSKDHKEVRDALAELNAAATAPAWLLLGQIAEVMNDGNEARDVYKRGLEKFADDPRAKRLFQNALNSMDSRPKEINLKSATQSRAAPLQMRQAVVLAVVGLQKGDADDEASEEAGFAFFEAVNLAEKHEYAEAIGRLHEAHQAHEKRPGFRNPRPKSDPHDEIFSRCCLQLEAYWKMRAELLAAGYSPPNFREPVAQQVKPLHRLVQDKKQGAMLASELKAVLEKNRLLTPTQSDPVEGLRTLLVNHEKARETIQALAENLSCPPKRTDLLAALERLQAGTCRPALELRDALVAELTCTGFLNNHQRNIIEGLHALVRDWKETKSRNEQLKSDRQAALAMQGRAETDRDTARARADGAEQAWREALSARAKVEAEKKAQILAREKVEAVNGKLSETVQAIAEKVNCQPTRPAILESLVRLLQNRGPRQMLPIWRQMLEDRLSPSLLATASADARQTIAESPPRGQDLRGQALYVYALALRHQGRVQESRSVLKEALAPEASEVPSSWRGLAQQTLDEMTSPVDYYLRRAGSPGPLRDRLDILEMGLKEVPGDGRLLARRSLYRLELAVARRPGRPPERAEVVKARQDAQAALAAGAKEEAWFAAGRAAEAMGDGEAAERHYRQALLDHSTPDELGITYRLALGRALCRQLPAPLPARNGVASSPELDEAAKLSDEAVRFGAAEGHLLKARIASVRGRWTEALHEHALYLKRRVPSEYADYGGDLQAVLDKDPALQAPAVAKRWSPQSAEKQYYLARESYFRGDYAEAEKIFRSAIYHDDLDARSWYFLGLCEVRLGKSQLAEDFFFRGAKLEEANRPVSTAVYLSLERVQGADRQMLNRFRPRR